ncbi:hypothetical protein [Streptomyces chrestomyceticus]|uniref:hypothetical protein n=1 Tax=Streptomyces chrestomyceticus TaxID=68185 RepID=UPI0033EBE7B2
MTQLPRHRTTVAAVLAAAVLAGCGTTPTDPAADAEPTRAAAPSSPPTKAAEPTSEPPEPSPLPSGAASTPRAGLPDPKKVNGQDPSAVGAAALTTMWTFDTAHDVSQHDATVRAIPYTTPKYGQGIRDTPPRSAPGAEWQRWATHHAYTKVTLTPSQDAGAPEDTPTDAYRTWTVTSTPHGDDGWTAEPTAVTAFVHLTRAGSAPWRVNAVQIQ